MYKEIPLLTPADVELRVAQIQQTKYGNYVTLLCYKDARCDMNILDEVFGRNNWKRTHEILNGNLFCIVSVWDEEKQQWVPKEDVIRLPHWDGDLIFLALLERGEPFFSLKLTYAGSTLTEALLNEKPVFVKDFI